MNQRSNMRKGNQAKQDKASEAGDNRVIGWTYRVVRSYDQAALAEVVEAYLFQGARLAGGVSIAMTPGGLVFAQALSA